MDTNRLKKFAVDARNKIKTGVEAKLSTLGFDSKGNVPDSMKPQLMQGGSLWNGQLMTEGFYHQWMALYDAVKHHGVRDVYEEAAYTWFNRLVAIRILQKNDLISPVLSYADAARTPQIVDDARSLNRIPPMPEADRQRLMELLDDDTKVTEQFAILISAYCHANPIIRQSFGRMADYTELLLPNNILAENGFIDDINHTEFITDEDYKSSELIGWLYQFYISERKDEVFAKKGKYDTDEIAPATQIFTPHWIVEYMVQNTIGRIYVDWHPEATEDFVSKWKYLVPQSEPRDISLPSPLERGGGEVELTDLRFADLGCGSGHILGYMFDILFDLYIYEGYTRKEAVENILRYNLTGVDIDQRAKQLATFALLLKACQKDESFRDGDVLPHVLTMPEPIAEADRHQLFHEFFEGEETDNILAELDDAFDLLKDAQTLGSIMKFNLSKSTLLAIRQTMDYWSDQSIVPDSVTRLLPSFHIILALTQKYTALVMNPPYMGSGRFDNVLSKYVKDNYPAGKADLFSVFMLVAKDRLVQNGKYAMINMQSWMFLSSFQLLREDLLESMQIDSMLHLGPHTFDELSGEVVQNVAFVVSNHKPITTSTYYRLVDGKNCADKEKIFLSHINSNDEANVYYPYVKQSDFGKIPGSTIGYWVSRRIFAHFAEDSKLDDIADLRSGISTGDNNRFYRFWYECSINKISLNYDKTPFNSGYKWFKIIRGGSFRRWYGCCDNVINLENSCHDISNSGLNHRLRTAEYYNKLGITWNRISSNKLGFRVKSKDFNFGENSPCMFFNNDEDVPIMLGLLNSNIIGGILSSINPTLSYQVADLVKLPIASFKEKSKVTISLNVTQNIVISKLDWDSSETSWDFAENPLVAIMKQAEGEEPIVSLEETNGFKQGNQWFSTEKPMVSRHDTDAFAAENCHAEAADAPEASLCDDRHTSLQQPCNDITKPLYDDYNALVNSLQGLCHPADGVTTHGSTLELCVNAFEKLWTARFMQLHANEEELNRQFIDIYGLQDELTPDVPLNEITILQQGEISIE